MSKEKKNASVNIQHLEEAFSDTDLSEFKPGATYPMSKLFDALGLLHVHGRPKLRPSGNVRGDTK
jgi:hypothetical protein